MNHWYTDEQGNVWYTARDGVYRNGQLVSGQIPEPPRVQPPSPYWLAMVCMGVPALLLLATAAVLGYLPAVAELYMRAIVAR